MTHDHEHDPDEHDHDHAQEHDDEAVDREEEARRRHALAQIRQYPDVALRLRANEVTEFDDDLRALAGRMERLMDDAQGIGLAATQVGVLRRLFVFRPDDEGARAVVNPRLVETAQETETQDEGCLSLQGVRVPVARSVRVTLAGQDLDGEDVTYELDGMGARVVQHESDHLDGVLIVDRTDDDNRRRALAILRPQPVLR
jgi:peptide deformylase